VEEVLNVVVMSPYLKQGESRVSPSFTEHTWTHLGLTHHSSKFLQACFGEIRSSNLLFLGYD